jgi:hypothetical protein
MIFDYSKNKYTELTPTVILAAKKDLSSWLGTIEAGREVAAAVLENRVICFFFRLCLLNALTIQDHRRKCITCSEGSRAKSKSTKGSALRGFGPGYLHCECPVETGLIELWISKISAQNPDIPKRGDDNDDGKEFTKADFAFNPVTLRIVSSAIEEASGLTTQTMFAPKLERLKTTVRWAFEELKGAALQDSDVCDLEAMAEDFETVVASMEKNNISTLE